MIEGNHYFPPEAVNFDLLVDSATDHAYAHGRARLIITRSPPAAPENKDAAWYYPSPKPAAAEIQDRVAFWKGVEIS